MYQYKVRWFKNFTTGTLRGLNIECSLPMPDIDHASNFVNHLGGPDREHSDLVTNNSWYCTCARIEPLHD